MFYILFESKESAPEVLRITPQQLHNNSYFQSVYLLEKAPDFLNPFNAWQYEISLSQDGKVQIKERQENP